MESKMQRVARLANQTKLTENGAVAYNTTNNALIDLFGVIGALRPRSESDIEQKFMSAFREDKLLATKMMFYAGNIRGGLGERRTFRVILKWMANNYPEIVVKNMGLIPYFNRFDSIFVLENTPVEAEMWKFISEQLVEDLENYKKNKSISLLAKWMPSENASSAATRKLARKASFVLGFTQRQYRKMLSALRKYIDVTEVKMSAKDWGNINYEAVPSNAMMRYANAFNKNDFIRFNEYRASLIKGEKKVNASTLFPYDLVKNYLYGPMRNPLVEEQWKALPNYVDEESNILVMADVSGSMNGRPMETSVGLAIYFAERNVGPMEGVYMTFTDRPHFITLDKNSSLKEKVRKVNRTDVGYSTNLNAAFDYLLDTAITNEFKPEDMPSAIVVISDMEIDRYMRPGANYDFIDVQRKKFNAAGYELPKLILWNVEARQDTFLSQSEDVIFISGQSPSSFRHLLGNIGGKGSYEVMLETLNDKMYDCVVI